MAKPHIHCPVNGWDCPYFDANGICMMYPESDPIQECDDFAFFWEEGEDYICYDDHEAEDEEEHCFEPGRYFKSMFELNP